MSEQSDEVVGVFESADLLEDAAEGLMSRGFDRSWLSLRAADQALEDIQGSRRIRPATDPIKAGRLPYMDHHDLALGQAAAISTPFYVGIVVTLWSIVSGANPVSILIVGLLGVVVATALGFGAAHVLGQATARKIKREQDQGGIVLWVRTPGPDDASRALTILTDHGASQVRGLSWRH